MASTSTSYAYAPLAADEFRLLQYTSDPTSDELHFSITTFRHAEAPPYIALSYEWELTFWRCTVHLGSSRHQMSIGRNLHEYLLRLREELSGTYFWADAICINQGDVLERNAQVRRMGDIFSNAVAVNADKGDRGGLESDDALLYDYYDDVSKRSYWSRVWMTQEVVLAKTVTVYCGRYAMQWPSPYRDRVRVRRHLEACGGGLGNRGETRKYLARFLRKSQKYMPLYECMNSPGSQASDPKDKIFALLPLLSPVEHDKVCFDLPDYGLTMVDLLGKVAMRITPGHWKFLVREASKALETRELVRFRDEATLKAWKQEVPPDQKTCYAETARGTVYHSELALVDRWMRLS